MRRSFSRTRLFALLAKEFIQMRRDRVTFAMMLVVPLMQLVLFGYAINSDPRGLPAAIVMTSEDRYSRAFVTALENTGYYSFEHIVHSAEEGEDLMARGEIVFLITIPSDLSEKIGRGEPAPILVEADATDPAAASGALSVLQTVAAEAIRREMPDAGYGAAPATPVVVVVHRRYNPESVSQFNIVPGLLGVILQMTMVMMTSIALTRESERGTMENLLAMPTSPLEIMLGKVLPYLVVGAVQVAVVLTTAKILFGIPFVGSLPLLLSAVLAFVLALVLLGYTISTMARTQMQALQLTFFFFLPSILLSGFMFPFRGMPEWAQWIGEIFPLTHFLRITRAVMLKGADLPEIAPEAAILVVFIFAYGGFALSRFRRTLD
jgi:ABC-2 type transport system permease protein